MRRLPLMFLFFALCCCVVGAQQAGTLPNGGGGSSLPQTLTASYVLSVSGGTVTANPGVIGGSIFTGTDTAVVIGDVISALAPSCGQRQVQAVGHTTS